MIIYFVDDNKDEKISAPDSSVRKRNIPKDESEEDFTLLTNSVQDIQLDSTNSAVKKKPKDPIKWFGLLVPQTLRQSQTRFKSAIELTVELANLESQYRSLQVKYKDLLKEKKRLKDLDGEEASQNSEEDSSPNVDEYDFVKEDDAKGEGEEQAEK